MRGSMSADGNNCYLSVIILTIQAYYFTHPLYFAYPIFNIIVILFTCICRRITANQLANYVKHTNNQSIAMLLKQ